jgi:hypothetical protein
LARKVASFADSFTPAKGLLLVRDQLHYDDAAGSQLIDEAYRNVVGSGRQTLYIKCATDLLKVDVELQVWDTRPSAGVGAGWSRPTTPAAIEFPSAELVIGDSFGAGFGTAPLPTGEGAYQIEVLWRGREGASVRAAEVLRLIATMSPDDEQRTIDRYAGLEKYRIRLWPDSKSR